MGREAFLKEVSKYRRALLDTSVPIYFLQKVVPYSGLVEPLFRLIEEQAIEARLSVITEAELLVGPVRKNDEESLNMVQAFLNDFPGIDVVPVLRPIAQEAAKLRAGSGLPLPDALIIATAKVSGCEAIVGNDLTWAKIEVLPVILLDDYCNDRENP